MQSERKVSVLLVDDQPSNLLALEAILGEAGLDLNLVRARSGEEALRRVLDVDFAAILMDVQMPGLGGFETAELIRERDRSRHTPILFLTAFQTTDAQIHRGYALGAVDFLSKPVVPAVLRSKIAFFVELFQKTEQVQRQAAQLIETQRREHQRTLAEEKRRWEVERLRAEAACEKQAAVELAQKAAELTRSIAERIAAEDQLRHRAAQQAMVADLGQRALSGIDLDVLLTEAVAAATRSLGVQCGRVMEWSPPEGRLVARAGLGWRNESTWPLTVEPGGESLAGFTLLAGEPVVVEDLRTERRFEARNLLRDQGVVSGLSVVIQGRERPFGTMGVFSTTPRTFSRDDVHFLQSVANVLAAAIQRRRDEQELAAIRDELAVQLADMTRLHALGARLSNSLELPAVLREVLNAVTGLQGTDRGVVMLHDRGRNAITTAASVGISAEQRLDLENANLQPCAAGLGENLTPHLAEALKTGGEAISNTPLRTCGGALIGSIATIFPGPHRPCERETRLVELYARQAAEFIDNARLYREIREADRRKGEFLAMLGHELRNPLAPILNALQIMRLPSVGPGDIEQAWAIADRQVRHLSRLVDDLLDVSRINSGKVELRRGPIDLREVVNRSIETACPLIATRHHELTVTQVETPLPLDADAARLEQVFANLLNNAAKYTEPGGRIELETSRAGDDGVVRLVDNGIGIAPDLLPRVFDLFTQSDRALDRSQGGLGIGLTLVRRLVEMHGGSVSAFSAGIGYGSEFVVRLPLGLPLTNGLAHAPSDREPAAGPLTASPPKRVLIVDDNVDAALMLARLLQASDHQIDVAHDGPTALKLARTTPPDIILLDIGLPGMDGYEVARRLRQMDRLDRITLIALTGYGQDEDRLRSRAAGFDHHLVKPVDLEPLEALIGDSQPLPRNPAEVAR